MVFCFHEGFGACGRTTIGIGLSCAIECGGGGRVGFTFGILHSAWVTFSPFQDGKIKHRQLSMNCSPVAIKTLPSTLTLP
jgi:hypothetical protein